MTTREQEIFTRVKARVEAADIEPASEEEQAIVRKRAAAASASNRLEYQYDTELDKAVDQLLFSAQVSREQYAEFYGYYAKLCRLIN